MPTFYAPRQYENPLTAQGRARTIAAFHVAQGSTDELTTCAEMRRDLLNKLMSPRAVGYWLNDKEWLRLNRSVGRVQLLCLTDAGFRTCVNSLAGGSEVPTTIELVQSCRRAMSEGDSGYVEFHLALLPGEA